MWTLVIALSVWVHGTGESVNHYSFSPPVSQAECQVLKGWVDKREAAHENGNGQNQVQTFCVPISK